MYTTDKRRFLLCVFPLLLVLFLLAACGTSVSNVGPVADSHSSNQTSTVKLHSGGCWTRGDTDRSDGDQDHRSTDYQGRGVKDATPSLGGIFTSCASSINLSVFTNGYSGGTDFFQIRWSRPGIAEQQFSTSTGHTDFINAHFQTVYRFVVQGCESHWYGSSCSDWSYPIYVATYYPGDCHPGYVWRNAFSGDTVCVLPATRDQVAYDNSQRFNRVDPQGPYGPDSCIQGYVWRNATSGDTVCVLPTTRDLAAYDNSQAYNRSYH